MQLFVDIEQLTVKPLFYAGTQTNADGTAQDLSAANGPCTNFLLNAGTCVGDATVVVQESDSTTTGWAAIHTFTITAGSTPAIQKKRLVRSKQYVRGVTSGITTTVQFGLEVIAQTSPNAPSDNLGFSTSPQS
jgi:hypothetical protein